MVKRVTIRKLRRGAFDISVGGRAIAFAKRKAEARQKANAFRRQLRRKR